MHRTRGQTVVGGRKGHGGSIGKNVLYSLNIMRKELSAAHLNPCDQNALRVVVSSAVSLVTKCASDGQVILFLLFNNVTPQ